MAESPSHKFGQIVGNLIESILLPTLTGFCERRALYLDTKGPRGKARSGRKVTWTDRHGNEHDLDFVIEKGGSADRRGRPVAFIEAAWRRYTKHSRNKAQEIQGAVLPIAEHHAWDAPFLGAVVAGVFTEGSLTQLRSVGFEVLYIPYDSIVDAFAQVGIDVRFDEATPDHAFAAAVQQIAALPDAQRARLRGELLDHHRPAIDEFLQKLESTLDRMIDFIAVIPLYGREHRFHSPEEAIEFLYAEPPVADGAFRKFEIIVRFTNGDAIDASFADAEKAVGFLRYLAS